MRLILILTAAAGLTGCATPANDSAICAGLARPIAALRGALLAHPETPQAVGESGTRVVVLTEAGCTGAR